MEAPPIPIVVIDDNPIDREHCCRLLMQAFRHYEVHQAADGQSGIRLARHVNAACVLLDLRLAHESGYETLNTLVSSTPSIPVIMLTGARAPALEEGAMCLGASAYLIKGNATAESLHEAVKHAIANRERSLRNSGSCSI
jgi:DNA-binding NarL/FixJ family response regulator